MLLHKRADELAKGALLQGNCFSEWREEGLQAMLQHVASDAPRPLLFCMFDGAFDRTLAGAYGLTLAFRNRAEVFHM